MTQRPGEQGYRLPERVAEPGEYPLPEVPTEAYAPGATPLRTLLEGEEHVEQSARDAGTFIELEAARMATADTETLEAFGRWTGPRFRKGDRYSTPQPGDEPADKRRR